MYLFINFYISFELIFFSKTFIEVIENEIIHKQNWMEI